MQNFHQTLYITDWLRYMRSYFCIWNQVQHVKKKKNNMYELNLFLI